MADNFWGFNDMEKYNKLSDLEKLLTDPLIDYLIILKELYQVDYKDLLCKENPFLKMIITNE